MKLKLLIFFISVCFLQTSTSKSQTVKTISPGAEHVVAYKPMFKNKTIAVVANQTSMVGKTHLVDTMIKMGANVKKIFCPEHGFRGNEEAGKYIKNGKDTKTGLPVISLYGTKLKPSAADLEGIDLLFYDLQDVGVRCYTYISTLAYVMQACSENFVGLVILDRPNPLGFYVDGPVLEPKYRSFVGMLPIPLVYGMTPGELAKMVNDEEMLPNKEHCSVWIIECRNYSHNSFYELPLNPSPNLRNMESVYLYPSLVLFEGTGINVGRATSFPFQVFGCPEFNDTLLSYMPKSTSKSLYPHIDKQCYGVDLRNFDKQTLQNKKQIDLSYVIFAYKNYPQKNKFFNTFFENIAGTADLRKQIIKGMSEEKIRESWQPKLSKFKEIRKKHLIYPDFE